MELNFGGRGSFGRTKLNRDSSLGVTGQEEERGSGLQVEYSANQTRGQNAEHVIALQLLFC